MIETKYRLLPNHNLCFYVPEGELIRGFILVSSNKSSMPLPQAKTIEITQRIRSEDNKWLLSFHLIDNLYDKMFDKFCRELFENTANLADPVFGPDEVLLEFAEWKNLFSVESLNHKDIQGLIGELLFLRDYLIPKYGEINALESWTRTNSGKQDFIIDDTWYEVKSTRLGSNKVVISSVEQLDTKKKGHLAVVVLQRTNCVSNNSFNLNSLYECILNELSSPHSKLLFENALSGYGIPDDRYTELVFEEINIESYLVDESFPRIKSSNIPQGVVVSSYEIVLSSINQYKEEMAWTKN